MLDLSVQLADDVLRACRKHGFMMVTAESCTGGLIAAALTSVPGSSDVVDRGFVTYSNAAKTEVLGVPADVLAAHGAVSEVVARLMADGALTRSRAGIAVSVTGIAGPGGGTHEKPVGLVHFGCAIRGGAILHRERRFGEQSREEIRRLSVIEALGFALSTLAEREAVG